MKAFTTEDILVLGRMGYSNEDVVKLMKVRLAEPEPAPEKKQEEKKEEKKEEKQEDKKLESKMDELLTLMQKGFIGASEQPKTESTDDILAQIINPKGFVTEEKKGV